MTTCKKEMRRIEFEEAIETENAKPMSTTIDTNALRKCILQICHFEYCKNIFFTNSASSS